MLLYTAAGSKIFIQNFWTSAGPNRYSYRSPDVYDRHNENRGDGGLFELEVIDF